MDNIFLRILLILHYSNCLCIASAILPHGCVCFDTMTTELGLPCQKFDCGMDLFNHNVPFCTKKATFERSSEWSWKKNPGLMTLLYHLLHDLLCVQYDNSAYKGLFYVNDQSTSLQLVESETRNNKTSLYSKIEQSTSYLKEQDTYDQDYDMALNQADIWNIPIVTNSSGSLCNEMLVGMEVGANQDYTCNVPIDNLEHDCKYQLNFQMFTNAVFVHTKIPTSSILNHHDEINSSHIPIKISSIMSLDGTVLDPMKTVTSWKKETSECHNALHSIQYKIHHDTSTGGILEIEAFIIVFASISKFDQENIPASPINGDSENLTQEIGKEPTLVLSIVQSIDRSSMEPSSLPHTAIHWDSTIHTIPPSTRKIFDIKTNSLTGMTTSPKPKLQSTLSLSSLVTSKKVSTVSRLVIPQLETHLSLNSLKQHFAVSFVSINTNTNKDHRSPGYLLGEPVKSGKKSRDGMNMIISNSGLMINNFGTESGGCLSSAKTFVSGFFS